MPQARVAFRYRGQGRMAGQEMIFRAGRRPVGRRWLRERSIHQAPVAPGHGGEGRVEFYGRTELIFEERPALRGRGATMTPRPRKRAERRYSGRPVLIVRWPGLVLVRSWIKRGSPPVGQPGSASPGK